MRFRRFGLIQELKIDLLILGLCIVGCSMCYVKADDPGLARRVIRILQTSGDSPDVSAISFGATKYLSSQDAEAIEPILTAMKSQPLTVVNWLRCAFDDIADRELASGGKHFDRKVLRTITEDSQHSGYARRLALDLLDRLEPGTTHRFLLSQLSDTEFSADAVAETLVRASEIKNAGDTIGATTLLKTAFSATVEPEQARIVAAQLTQLGTQTDVAAHLGTVTQWQVIGPFPGRDMKAVTEVFPPEEKIDFAATYEGKSGSIAWKSFAQNSDDEWIDFKKVLGDADDAVAYAAANVVSDRNQEVELRAGADDNLQLWVNGERVLASIEYYQRPRTDRHRVTVRLKPGSNTILAKVCEAKLPPGPPSGGPARWQFGLRIVDERGHGMSLPDH
jgi:hypothetical protein